MKKPGKGLGQIAERRKEGLRALGPLGVDITPSQPPVSIVQSEFSFLSRDNYS